MKYRMHPVLTVFLWPSTGHATTSRFSAMCHFSVFSIIFFQHCSTDWSLVICLDALLFQPDITQSWIICILSITGLCLSCCLVEPNTQLPSGCRSSEGKMIPPCHLMCALLLLPPCPCSADSWLMRCPAVISGLAHLQTSRREYCVTAGPFMPDEVSPHSHPLPRFSHSPTFTLMSPVSHWLQASLRSRKMGSVWLVPLTINSPDMLFPCLASREMLLFFFAGSRLMCFF